MWGSGRAFHPVLRNFENQVNQGSFCEFSGQENVFQAKGKNQTRVLKMAKHYKQQFR